MEAASGPELILAMIRLQRNAFQCSTQCDALHARGAAKCMPSAVILEESAATGAWIQQQNVFRFTVPNSYSGKERV